MFNDDQKDLIKQNIAWREMLAIVQSLATWGNLLQGKKVLCHCDNSVVVSVIQKGSSKDKDLMELVRGIFYICVKYEFEFSAIHVPGIKNKIVYV